MNYKGWLVVLLFFCGCTSVRYVKSISGQPQASYFSLSKDTSHQKFGELDTNMIYVNAQDWVRTYESGKKEKLFLYRYIKFGGNRVAFCSGGNKETFDDINVNTVNGGHCFYKIKADEVQLEIFDLHLKKFIIWTGKIYSDRIYFYKDKVRVLGGGKGKLDLIYYKKPVKCTKTWSWPE